MLPHEEELVKLLISKEDVNSAFSQLIALYKERLYWHIRHMVKNHDDANDILQNVYIKVYHNIKKFKGQSKLYSWLYRIATNEAISFINKKAKKLHISNQELQEYLVNNLEADSYYDGDAIQLQLQKALATLPEKQRQVFQMKYFEELKYREIAEILGTSEGALKASYHLAVKKIEAYVKSN